MAESTMHELRIERVIEAPPSCVWAAWTQHLARWWCPRPWTTDVAALDLRPGGRCSLTMRGPDGEESPVEGIFLEVTPERRIAMTNAVDADWRPQPPFMVGVYDFAAEGAGTRYAAAARHWSAADRDAHVAMGFEAGWNAATDQLAEVARRLAAG